MRNSNGRSEESTSSGSGSSGVGGPSEKEFAYFHQAALGRSAAEIARLNDATPAEVEQGLERVERHLADDYEAGGQRGSIRQTHLLNWICRESLDAWNASKQPQESTKVSTDGSGPDGKSKAERTTRQQPGDPRYLSHAIAALAAIRRMWGLDEAGGVSAKDDENLRVVEDEAWYGNSAHGLFAQAAPASDADSEIAGAP